MRGFLTLAVLPFLLSILSSEYSTATQAIDQSVDQAIVKLSAIQLNDVLTVMTLAEDLREAKSEVTSLEDFHDFRTELLRLSVAFDDLDDFRQELICESFHRLPIKDLFELGDFFISGYDRKVSNDEGAAVNNSCAMDLVFQLQRFWEEKERELERIYGVPSRDPIEMVDYFVPDASYLDGVNSFGHPLPEGYFALTFDDGPHPTRTHKVLDTLEEFEIQATFFMVGHYANKYSDIAETVRGQGHSVGSHSFNHPNMRKMSFEDARDNIYRGHEYVTDAVLEDSYPFFRFPYGNHTSDLRGALKNRPLSEFFWNVDTRDWATQDPVELVENVLKMLERQKRGIVLFHDVQEQTAMALPYILEEMKARGYKLVLYQPEELVK